MVVGKYSTEMFGGYFTMTKHLKTTTGKGGFILAMRWSIPAKTGNN